MTKGRSLCSHILLLVLSLSSVYPAFADVVIINETSTVSSLSYRYWYRTFYSGDHLVGSIYVSGYDINFYIMDSSNFVKFTRGDTFITYYSRKRVSSLPSMDFTVPYDGTWYIVLDNQYSIFTSKSVNIEISLEQNASGITSFATAILIILAFAGGAIVLYYIVKNFVLADSTKRDKPDQPHMQIARIRRFY